MPQVRERFGRELEVLDDEDPVAAAQVHPERTGAGLAGTPLCALRDLRVTAGYEHVIVAHSSATTDRCPGSGQSGFASASCSARARISAMSGPFASA